MKFWENRTRVEKFLFSSPSEASVGEHGAISRNFINAFLRTVDLNPTRLAPLPCCIYERRIALWVDALSWNFLQLLCHTRNKNSWSSHYVIWVSKLLLSSLVVAAADTVRQRRFEFEQDKLHLLGSGLSIFYNNMPVSWLSKLHNKQIQIYRLTKKFFYITRPFACYSWWRTHVSNFWYVDYVLSRGLICTISRLWISVDPVQMFNSLCYFDVIIMSLTVLHRLNKLWLKAYNP